MKTAFLLLTVALFSCDKIYIGYPPGDIHKQKFHKGDLVKLNDITIPKLVEPVRIDTVYWDSNIDQYRYDGYDKRDTLYYGFCQYQLKKY